MVDVTEILIHWHAGRSISEVSTSLGVDRKTARYAAFLSGVICGPAGAENYVRPGHRGLATVSDLAPTGAVQAWRIGGGRSARMRGYAAATGIPSLDQRVGGAAPAPDERPGQGRGNLGTPPVPLVNRVRAYAAWAYSLMSPLRIVRRRTRTAARSMIGGDGASAAGGS